MQKPARLPIRITIFLWLVLTITAWNIVRVITSVLWRGTLETYAPQTGPLYIGITGTIWALAGMVLLFGFVRSARWFRIILLITACSYSAWIWADKLFVQSQLRANWPFDLLCTILLLGFTVGIVLHPNNQNYFMKRAL